MALVSINALTYPLSAKADIKDEIIAELHTISDDDILVEIATEIIDAESEFNPKAKNKYSSAKGLFQFLKGTWRENCEGNVLDWHDNLACGARIIQEGRYSHWNASRHIWLSKLSYGAKLRIKGSKVIAFLDRYILINKRGDIIHANGKIWKGGELPFLD